MRYAAVARFIPSFPIQFNQNLLPLVCKDHLERRSVPNESVTNLLRNSLTSLSLRSAGESLILRLKNKFQKIMVGSIYKAKMFYSLPLFLFAFV